MMNINEKIGLYEYCRGASGKSYHNLTSKRKETIKKEYRKSKSNTKKRERLSEDRKLGLIFPFQNNVIKNLVLQN